MHPHASSSPAHESLYTRACTLERVHPSPPNPHPPHPPCFLCSFKDAVSDGKKYVFASNIEHGHFIEVSPTLARKSARGRTHTVLMRSTQIRAHSMHLIPAARPNPPAPPLRTPSTPRPPRALQPYMQGTHLSLYLR